MRSILIICLFLLETSTVQIISWRLLQYRLFLRLSSKFFHPITYKDFLSGFCITFTPVFHFRFLILLAQSIFCFLLLFLFPVHVTFVFLLRYYHFHRMVFIYLFIFQVCIWRHLPNRALQRSTMLWI